MIPRSHHANAAELAAAEPETVAHLVDVAAEVAQADGVEDYRMVFNTGRGRRADRVPHPPARARRPVDDLAARLIEETHEVSAAGRGSTAAPGARRSPAARSRRPRRCDGLRAVEVGGELDPGALDGVAGQAHPPHVVGHLRRLPDVGADRPWPGRRRDRACGRSSDLLAQRVLTAYGASPVAVTACAHDVRTAPDARRRGGGRSLLTGCGGGARRRRTAAPPRPTAPTTSEHSHGSARSRRRRSRRAAEAARDRRAAAGP